MGLNGTIGLKGLFLVLNVNEKKFQLPSQFIPKLVSWRMYGILFGNVVVSCHSFCLFWYSLYIHSITFIHHIHPSPFAEVLVHRQQAQWEKPPGDLKSTSRRSTNWATPHPINLCRIPSFLPQIYFIKRSSRNLKLFGPSNLAGRSL